MHLQFSSALSSPGLALMIARRESFIVLSDNERTFEILFAILKFCINDINSFSISGLVSGDCVFVAAPLSKVLTYCAGRHYIQLDVLCANSRHVL